MSRILPDAIEASPECCWRVHTIDISLNHDNLRASQALYVQGDHGDKLAWRKGD
jgi:hypothetical protein